MRFAPAFPLVYAAHFQFWMSYRSCPGKASLWRTNTSLRQTVVADAFDPADGAHGSIRQPLYGLSPSTSNICAP